MTCRHTSSRFVAISLLCVLRQVLKKMLKAVEQLPICADDLHLTRSAHGTFADMLQQLTCHPEAEVSRTRLDELQDWLKNGGRGQR